MKTIDTPFYSEGLKLDGSFFMPEEGKKREGAPLLIICSGFMGLKNLHPARFARALTLKGYPCFGFDYRGFAKSEGEKRRVLLEEQISDIANAAAFAAAHPLSKGHPTVLMGWGMGAGLILEAAHLVPNVAALICLNGFYNGRRVQKMVRGYEGWLDFLKDTNLRRREMAQSGRNVDVEPFEIYPVDNISSGYVESSLRLNPDFGGKVRPLLADSLLRFAPEHNLEDLSSLPLLIVHGEMNRMHPPTEAESLYGRYPGPKELLWLWKMGHTEWMQEEGAVFCQVVEKIDSWLQANRGIRPPS